MSLSKASTSRYSRTSTLRSGEGSSLSHSRSNSAERRSVGNNKTIPRLSARYVNSRNVYAAALAAATSSTAAESDQNQEIPQEIDAGIPTASTPVTRAHGHSSGGPPIGGTTKHRLDHQKGTQPLKKAAKPRAQKGRHDDDSVNDGEGESSIFGSNNSVDAKAEELFAATLDRVLAMRKLKAAEKEKSEALALEREKAEKLRALEEHLNKKEQDEVQRRRQQGREYLEQTLKAAKEKEREKEKNFGKRSRSPRDNDALLQRKREYEQQVRRMNWKPLPPPSQTPAMQQHISPALPVGGVPVPVYTPVYPVVSESVSSSLGMPPPFFKKVFARDPPEKRVTANGNANSSTGSSRPIPPAQSSVSGRERVLAHTNTDTVYDNNDSDRVVSDYITFPEGEREEGQVHLSEAGSDSEGERDLEEEMGYNRALGESTAGRIPMMLHSDSNADDDDAMVNQEDADTHSRTQSSEGEREDESIAEEREGDNATEEQQSQLIEIPQIRLSLSGRIKSVLQSQSVDNDNIAAIVPPPADTNTVNVQSHTWDDSVKPDTKTLTSK